MRRQPIYSSSRTDNPKHGNDAAPTKPFLERLKSVVKRYDRYILLCLGALMAIGAVLIYGAVTPDPLDITQEDIDEAVLYSLDNMPPEPSAAAEAYQVIRPSVVLVRRLTGEGEDQVEEGAGTGVVVSNTGAILTSLHVVILAEKVQVVFSDGFETTGTMVSAMPDQDLAVIQADVVPEGLVPATLATTVGLRPGDEVLAVGYPFGIGESTSAGVVSGLGRTHVSEDGEVFLSDLIQFDAAANPGNSGGPLVNMNGEVVGIVSSIYNPNNERVFVGIGFAVPIETAAGGFGMLPY